MVKDEGEQLSKDTCKNIEDLVVGVLSILPGYLMLFKAMEGVEKHSVSQALTFYILGILSCVFVALLEKPVSDWIICKLVEKKNK